MADANLLIYASNAAAPQHAAANNWLEARLAGPDRVRLPWPTLLAFVRIVTHPRLFPRPAETIDAWRQVTNWLSSNVAWIPLPTERHAEVLAPFLALPDVRGNLVPDAHLAALAIEHGLVLGSHDGDFACFPGLRWQDPLAG